MGPADWLQVAQNVVSIAQGAMQIWQTILIKQLMDNMVNGQWLLEQARKWGIYFDKLILKYSNLVYNYFVQILEGNLFTPELIDGIMSRLYIIVGLVIFFKLATLAIKYISTPESFLDGKTGGEQLIKRILFGSVLIILMPLIFDIALDLQSAIISDNLIGKILLPKEIYNEYQNDKNNTGKKIGMMVVSGFFSWNDAVDKSQDNKAWNQYDRVVKYNDLELFDEEKINNKVNDEYVFSYVPIVSTLAVGYYLLTLLKYAAEVILRSFKLAFLQIIAPFSIVKWMLDPADTESLKKWLNTTVSTYIMLFLRVLTVWIIAMMAYYLKNGVPTSDGVVSLISNDTDEILKALIVLGMFAFLKELPKLFSDLFGYNLAENETIAGVANQAVGAVKGLALGKVGLEQQRQIMNVGMASGILGGAAGGVGAAAETMKNSSNTKAGIVNGVGSGLSHSMIGGANAAGSAYSGAVSANFGNSAFGALGRGANAYTNTSYQGNDRLTSDFKSKDDETKEAEKRQKKNTKEGQNVFNNVCQQTNSPNNQINLQNEQQRNAFFSEMQRSFEGRYGEGSKYIPDQNAIMQTINDLKINPTTITGDQVSTIYHHMDTMVEGSRQADSAIEADNRAAQESRATADALSELNRTLSFTPSAPSEIDTPRTEASPAVRPDIAVGRPSPPPPEGRDS